MNSRTLRMVIDAEFDRPLTPRLAHELYWIFQMFTALISGFTLIAVLFSGNFLLFLVGLVLAPVAWLIASMSARMAIEVALVVFDLHQRVSRATDETPPPPPPPTTTQGATPIPPAFGKALRTWEPRHDA